MSWQRLRTEAQDTELDSVVAEWFVNSDNSSDPIGDGLPYLTLSMADEMRTKNENVQYLISYFIEPFMLDVLNEVVSQESPTVYIMVTGVRSGEFAVLLPYERMDKNPSSPPLEIQRLFTL